MSDSPDSPPPGSAHLQQASSLPYVATSLIARTADIASLIHTVLEGASFTTVIGPAGVGKTRVALAVAQQVMTLGHRVDLVPLADILDPTLVLPAIVRALGIRETDATESGLAGIIARHIGDGRRVLVLDNAEHLLAATPDLVEIRRQCPHLAMLVTSRVRLRVQGEQVVPLAPLSVDDAVQLYRARMPLHTATVPMTEDDLATIREICQQLDCLPLAVELAASWADILSPRAMLRRLGNGASVLGDRSGAASRFHSMPAAIDWSYHLLPPDAQRLFRHLSVFQGGATETMASALWESLEPGGASVLSLLATLTDHQLLAKHDDDDGEPRFEMLVTIRDVARAKLQGQGELNLCQDQVANLMLDLVRDADTHLQGPRQQVWLNRFAAEYRNIQAVLGLLLAQNDRRGRLMAGAFWRYWLVTGSLTEGRHWLERACAMPHAGDTSGTNDVLRGAGLMATMQGDYHAAEHHLLEARDVAQQTNDVAGLAKTLSHLGVLEHYRGNLPQAAIYQDEAAVLFHGLGDEAGKHKALGNMGNVLRIQGRLAEARLALETSLHYARRAGEPHGLAAAIDNLAGVSFEEQDYAAVLRAATETYEIRRALPDRFGMLSSLSNMATAHAMLNDLTAAVTTSHDALDLARDLGETSTESILLGNLGDMLRQQGELDRAADAFRRAHDLASDAGPTLAMPGICRNWARTELDRGNHAEALALYRKGLRTAIPLERPSLVVDCVEGVAAACGNPALGSTLLGWVQHTRIALDEELDAVDQQFFDDSVAAVRAQLPAGQWSGNEALGQRVSMTEVLDWCLHGNPGQALPAVASERASEDWDLTPRQHEVLELLTGGMTDQQIANALYISRPTASKHVAAILEKLAVDNRAAAIALALQQRQTA